MNGKESQNNFCSIYYQNPFLKNKFKKVRSESLNHNIQKSFTTNNYELYDREQMEEEMSKLMKEIALKSREYEALRRTHYKIESENVKTIKDIETLISDCKQIQNPIEKNNSLSQLTSARNQNLLINLQETLTKYQDTLVLKEKQLSELKENNPKILRLFEIEEKLINANETYEKIFIRHTSLIKRITDLDNETVKAIESREYFKGYNLKIKQEIDDLKGKIVFNENEQNELLQREKFLEEKNSTIKEKLVELKKTLKSKDEDLELLKIKMTKVQVISSEKEKSESNLNNQFKQLQILKDQNEKKTKQLKDLEKTRIEYAGQANEIKNVVKEPSARLLTAQKERQAKEEEYEEMKLKYEQLKKEKDELIIKFKPKGFEIQAQISYSLNVPLSIDNAIFGRVQD